MVPEVASKSKKEFDKKDGKNHVDAYEASLIGWTAYFEFEKLYKMRNEHTIKYKEGVSHRSPVRSVTFSFTDEACAEWGFTPRKRKRERERDEEEESEKNESESESEKEKVARIEASIEKTKRGLKMEDADRWRADAIDSHWWASHVKTITTGRGQRKRTRLAETSGHSTEWKRIADTLF